MRLSFPNRMLNLAARFSPAGHIHVVDPHVFLLPTTFRDLKALEENVKARGMRVDVTATYEAYQRWWKLYACYVERVQTEAGLPLIREAKRDMKAAYSGLLGALALPNSLDPVVDKSPSTSTGKYVSNHVAYLNKNGLLSFNKEVNTINMLGYLPAWSRTLRELFLNKFPGAVVISPSNFARAAVIEGCHEEASNFSGFTEGTAATPEMYLVGNSLPSLVSTFVRAKFSYPADFWPVSLHSAGPKYHAQGGLDLISCRQRDVYVQLIMHYGEDGINQANEKVKAIIADLLRELGLSVNKCELSASQLYLSERRAISFSIGDVELARISYLGDHISRRLNVQHETGFMHMGFAAVDIYRLIAVLVDGLNAGGKVPDLLRSQ
ncbi:unnamed protein product, partial [Mesorhabditis spiculigera]